MADYTENLNLKKPARTDYFSVADFNGNSDIIDSAVGSIDTALDGKLNTDFSNVSGGAISIANGGTGATTASGALTNLGVDTALSNKADKDLSNVTGMIPITAGGTGNASGYIRTGQKSGTTIGSYATCEGDDTTASGMYSHAEGANTTASGNYSHAEGDTTTASGNYAHAEGWKTTVSGNFAHAEGQDTAAKGYYSHATGYHTAANFYQTVVGRYNVEKGSTLSYTTDSGYLIVGCGTSSSATANCLRATESKVYGKTYSSSGADYAEMFEWLDGNISNEDRIGKFVTLDGDKIKLTTSQDDYILGVVSGNPSVIGDSHSDQWAYMFEQDIFGRPIYETVTIPEEKDDDGNIIVEEHTEEQLKVSKQYDNTQPYIARDKRKEWVAVGLLGKLICIDDGTAEINGYVRPNENSIATYSEAKTKYRVMKRIDETHIQIMIL